MIIRRVVPSDLPALRDLFLRSRRAAFGWVPSSSLAVSDFDKESSGELQWVALDGDRPVGFISIWEPDNFIHHLHVDPLFVRRGIGQSLLGALPRSPMTRYQLKCGSRNVTALAFYAANHFVQIGEGWADDHHYLLLEEIGERDR